MVLLELGRTVPAWRAALEVALTRPPGMPERREGEDPWDPRPVRRPRRATDDLAWLRRAMDDPPGCGLQHVDDDDERIRVWEISDFAATAKLERLNVRGVLEAAGFELHHEDLPLAG
ncbi:MAG: hypothetical protein QOF76_5057 [Solirubrobacteraceae bacterium]|nr:hypothetical protein [Solirubrobacteraceae bacterium]